MASCFTYAEGRVRYFRRSSCWETLGGKLLPLHFLRTTTRNGEDARQRLACRTNLRGTRYPGYSSRTLVARRWKVSISGERTREVRIYFDLKNKTQENYEEPKDIQVRWRQSLGDDDGDDKQQKGATRLGFIYINSLIFLILRYCMQAFNN